MAPQRALYFEVFLQLVCRKLFDMSGLLLWG